MSQRPKIEIRTDQGDFSEIWVNGTEVMSLCSDDDDLGTATKVAMAVGVAMGAEVVIDTNYEWDMDGLRRVEGTAP